VTFFSSPKHPPSLLFSGSRAVFLGVKCSGREVNLSLPSRAKVKNEWSYVSSLLCFHGVERHNFIFPPALNRKYSVTLLHTRTMVVFSTFREENKTKPLFMYDFIVQISAECK